MKQRRKHERTVAQSIGLSVAVAIGVGLICGIAFLLIQYSNPRLLYDLIGNNQSGEMERSELYQRLLQYFSIDDLVVTTICMLALGVTSGLTTPSYLPTWKKMAAGVCAGLIFVLGPIVLFQWGLKLLMQHGKVFPGQLTPQYLKTYAAVILVWLVIAAIGSALGLWIRAVKTKSKVDPAAKTEKKAAATSTGS